MCVTRIAYNNKRVSEKLCLSSNFTNRTSLSRGLSVSNYVTLPSYVGGTRNPGNSHHSLQQRVGNTPVTKCIVLMDTHEHSTGNGTELYSKTTANYMCIIYVTVPGKTDHFVIISDLKTLVPH